MGASRGLVSDNIRDQVTELSDLASHSRAARPIYHVHADPPAGAPLDAAGWNRYWTRFEVELGLGRQPFAEQIHVKDGREHRHREYSLVRPDGTTMPLHHDHARREKVGRITELDEGQALTPGAHNRAVLAALDREGRADVAAAMRVAGLDTMERSRAPTTPRQRAQAERTGIDPKVVAAAVLAAWKASDSGEAFRAALADRGLGLAQGDKVAVVIDPSCNVHPVARVLGSASKAAGTDRIGAADVRARLACLVLDRHVPGAAPPAPSADALPATPEPAHKEKTHDYEPRAQALVSGGRERDPGRDGGPGHGSGAHQDSRPERAEPCDVRRHEGSRDGRLLVAPARVAGTAGRAGEVQDRPDARSARKDRRGTDRTRAAHGRARILDEWVERGLALRLADGEREARLRALTTRLSPPAFNRRGVSLCPGLESEEELRAQRDRWLAAVLGRAYDLRWVPPSVVVNLTHIDVDQARQAVILTLRSGTRIVDRQTRIDVVGTADDVAVDEMVAAVQRRGWDAVRLHGNPAFRRAAAILLQLLDPPISVADTPLSEADQVEIDRLRRSRVPAPGSTPAPHSPRGPR